MNIKKLTIICMLLCGCAGGHQPLAFAPVDVATVIVSNELPEGAVLLQRVKVELCYNPFSSAPPRVEVLGALKRKVAAIGGNLVRHVSYNNTGLVSRCAFAGGSTATALAYRAI